VGLLLRPPVASRELSLLVHPDKLWSATWPVVLGIAIALGAWLLRRRGARIQIEIPPGDLIFLVEVLLKRLQRLALTAQEGIARVPLRHWSTRLVPIERLSGGLLRSADRAEASLAAFGTIGLLFLLLLVLLLAVLLVPIS
jgi:hypothetical protein